MSDMYDVDHLSVHPGDDAPPSAGEVYPEVIEEDRSGDGFTDFVSVTTPNGEIHVIKDVDGDGDADLYLLDQDGDGVAEVGVKRVGDGFYVYEDTDQDGNLDTGERTPSPTDGGDVWTRADLDSDPRFIGLVDVLDQAFDV
jgi:hypothetical protein